ncbi:transcription antitermination factor NusB [Desulfurivibrio alkaliphilus]|uniref:Transcription antitermination protein NusB n=1 Tax=Desulfurivibrio alkaliphilus (strain DSM 19089 / UNIQEM U267 / AHT2) TaxID=589865 RepID=D6Z345_DESAT|nr:transcription antitermination factor NusB [Desulfurivibrio alkaliphilus]ADH85970.1 NusB antitermination factor [Desulfurivibrio alkaliphilus AHT 2]
MGARRKSRELALQALYQADMSNVSALDTLPVLCENFEVSRKALPYGEGLVGGVVANLAAIDRIIEAGSAHWRVSRMSCIDRNIIRIAVYEFNFAADVPAGVAINEAIELAKRFGSEDSPAFINGVLDAIRKTLSRQGR